MKSELELLEKQTGFLFDIKRFAIHDGPGIRTTVFLKGCDLTCWWCHNPEGKLAQVQLLWVQTQCRFCGKCTVVCPQKSHVVTTEDDKPVHVIHRDRCNGCGICVEACPSGSLQLVGQTRTAGNVLAEVLEDKHFYTDSGGGITISGGEPLIQLEFSYALLNLAKANGIHTALDTHGGCDTESYEKVLPVTDLFLFDLKQMNLEKFQQWTGSPLEGVLQNLRWLSGHGAKLLLRCPIIPGVNAEEDNHWKGVADVAKELKGVVGIEYLPYHRLWIDKVKRLRFEMPPPLRDLPEVEQTRIEEIHAILKQSGKPVGKG